MYLFYGYQAIFINQFQLGIRYIKVIVYFGIGYGEGVVIFFGKGVVDEGVQDKVELIDRGVIEQVVVVLIVM